MGLLLIPLLISLMSPFALAAGLPSVALIIIWFLKLKEWAGTGNGNQNRNQVFLGYAYGARAAVAAAQNPGQEGPGPEVAEATSSSK